MLASGSMPLLSQSPGAPTATHGQLAPESRSDPAFLRPTEDAVRQQRTILLVEPDAPLRESWRAGLVAMGFHVREAGDAGGALSTAMRSQVDLLVTELYLPTAADRCLVRASRREPALRQMKILVISDHATADDRNWALAAGADAYLVKPVRLGRMLQVAGRLAMSRHRSRGQVRAAAGRLNTDPIPATISGERSNDSHT